VHQASPARHCPPSGERATSRLTPQSQPPRPPPKGGGKDGCQVSSDPPSRQRTGGGWRPGCLPATSALSSGRGSKSVACAERPCRRPKSRRARHRPNGFATVVRLRTSLSRPDPMPRRAGEWVVGPTKRGGPQAALHSSLPRSENLGRGLNPTSLVAFCIPNSLRARPRANPNPGGRRTIAPMIETRGATVPDGQSQLALGWNEVPGGVGAPSATSVVNAGNVPLHAPNRPCGGRVREGGQPSIHHLGGSPPKQRNIPCARAFRPGAWSWPTLHGKGLPRGDRLEHLLSAVRCGGGWKTTPAHPLTQVSG